jgi:hypothetical protein
MIPISAFGKRTPESRAAGFNKLVIIQNNGSPNVKWLFNQTPSTQSSRLIAQTDAACVEDHRVTSSQATITC